MINNRWLQSVETDKVEFALIFFVDPPENKPTLLLAFSFFDGVICSINRKMSAFLFLFLGTLGHVTPHSNTIHRCSIIAIIEVRFRKRKNKNNDNIRLDKRREMKRRRIIENETRTNNRKMTEWGGGSREDNASARGRNERTTDWCTNPIIKNK